MEQKKTVAIDFDGVINSYTSGWQGETHTDAPVPHCFEAIEALVKNYKVAIYTTRAKTAAGAECVRKYLADNLPAEVMEQITITDGKPIAFVYVDDRAITFDGNWEYALKNIECFNTWIECDEIKHKLVSRRIKNGCVAYLSKEDEQEVEAEYKNPPIPSIPLADRLQVVSVQQARRLQRLGYGWTCKLIYDENNNMDFIHECENYTLWDGCCYAPTTALALKWMRDIKGYYGHIFCSARGLFLPYIGKYPMDRDSKFVNACATYEQAESALLDCMLDRLEKEAQLNNVD